ncbi:uncharacterized protein LOC134275025 [Saccostrea cucullata]|uniref:uncharacterized protein LOC134275025 n=1 Tax=Saccostrea cuccullata TaxID=36930 RepID=UPI002ED0A959
MAPLSSLLLLVSLTTIVAAKEVFTTDGDRISHSEDVIKTLQEMQEQERLENARQNKRIWNLEESIARNEEENKKLKTKNNELKSKLNQMEISVGKMDAHVKRLQKENLKLIKTVKSHAKIINNIHFRILICNKQGLENSRKLENLVPVTGEEVTESKVQSNSLPSSSKRLLTGIPSTPQPNGVAFSVYLKPQTTHITEHQTILFDGILTNVGDYYNQHTGAFTAPLHGVYVFTWNLYCDANGGRVFSEIAVNSHQIGSMFTSGEGVPNIRTTTGIVVAEINKGDIVLVRTHPINGPTGRIISNPAYKSTFSGWFLF